MDIERIQRLDKKIQEASDYIIQLREEKQELSSRFANYEQRISELESQLQKFREHQTLIENSIENALTQLDILEEHMHSSSSQDTDVTFLKSEDELVKTETTSSELPEVGMASTPTKDPLAQKEDPSFWETTQDDEFSIFDKTENGEDIFSDDLED